MTPDDIVLTPYGLRFAGRRIPCSIGRGLLSRHKREGDGATPVATHTIDSVYYRADRLTSPSPSAIPIGPWDLWSDDSAQPDYNTRVKAPYAHSHEALRRADPLYDIVIVLDWNRPVAQPGRGSAIFLHQWRKPGHPTEGCIAVARRDLIWLAKHTCPGTRVIVPALSGRLSRAQ